MEIFFPKVTRWNYKKANMKQNPKFILRGPEIACFYSILSQYESETIHKGYNYSRIDKDLQAKINLELKKSPIVKPKENNTIYYTGNLKALDLFRHVRNAFAHCCIISDDNGMTYSFYDEYQGKCTMAGSMNKTLFKKLIKQLKDTRQ